MMAKLKHTLEIERTLRELLPEAQMEYRHSRKHRILLVHNDGVCGRFTISSSPSQPEHAVRNTVRQVAKFFNLQSPAQ